MNKACTKLVRELYTRRGVYCIKPERKNILITKDLFLENLQLISTIRLNISGLIQ